MIVDGRLVFTDPHPIATQPNVNLRIVSPPRPVLSFSSLISRIFLVTPMPSITNLVGIFNAEKELTARSLGQQIVEQRRPQ